MNQNEEEKFSADAVMSGLKDFQRRTVNYVFKRLYEDRVNPTNRFLIADEVGLGKTLVAKGVIAKAIEHLFEEEEEVRIDIVYICSNAAIAKQNINRLNVYGGIDIEFTTRLTMLPSKVETLTRNPINFISFTPSTTFNLNSRGGKSEERIIIYKMLKDEKWNVSQGLRNMLQGTVKTIDGWKNKIKDYKEDIDKEIEAKFRVIVNNDKELVQKLHDCCTRFQRHRKKWAPEDSNFRYELIGELRSKLAHTCIDALEPDLVILDEFQRFNDLLDGDNYSDASLLAKRLFEYKNVCTLLLSATPYKMLTLNHEEDDDHYKDFMQTMKFLFQGDVRKFSELEENIRKFRKNLLNMNSAEDLSEDISQLRNNIQNNLLSVMCRTERVGLTEKLDSMLKEIFIEAPIESGDLNHASAVGRVAQVVKARDTTEYWKSSPYLLNFLRNYELRVKIDENASKPPMELKEAIQSAENQILRKDQFDDYEEINPGNGRMRTLFDETINQDMWRLLWLPPSLEYMKPSGVYANTKELTKRLVFSKWSVVPDAIAALCSYDAERQMIGEKRETHKLKHSTLTNQSSQLLRITKGNKGQLAGMSTIPLLFPSTILAKKIDPLKIVIEEGNNKPLSKRRMLRIAETKCKELLKYLPRGIPAQSADSRWYWAAPAILEIAHKTEVIDRVNSSKGWVYQEGDGGSLKEHLDLLVDVASGAYKIGERLGPKPKDLARFLAELSLGGPSICALRSLYRIAPNIKQNDQNILSASTKIAEGFRSLYNLPQSIALLQALSFDNLTDSVYWRKAIHYGIDGNIQAILDEQVHVLLENLGLSYADDIVRVKEISENLANSLTIQTAQIKIDELKTTKRTIKCEPFNSRCRFAMRFSEIKDDNEDTLSRIENVRSAFNSPFRPFILASTSIGQEGLDFHTWCHALVHWNLPTNPVDLEQREGRVHRYKGHAVRKNVAEHIGLEGLMNWDGIGDPWQILFDEAKKNRPKGSSDLIPFWIYENGSAKVERRVPVLPLSREEHQLEMLKKNLALYRLVFGQPRQEDLLAHISDSVSDNDVDEIISKLQISLQPPDELREND